MAFVYVDNFLHRTIIVPFDHLYRNPKEVYDHYIMELSSILMDVAAISFPVKVDNEDCVGSATKVDHVILVFRMEQREMLGSISAVTDGIEMPSYLLLEHLRPLRRWLKFLFYSLEIDALNRVGVSNYYYLLH
jgi:hypothetical protein